MIFRITFHFTPIILHSTEFLHLFLIFHYSSYFTCLIMNIHHFSYSSVLQSWLVKWLIWILLLIILYLQLHFLNISIHHFHINPKIIHQFLLQESNYFWKSTATFHTFMWFTDLHLILFHHRVNKIKSFVSFLFHYNIFLKNILGLHYYWELHSWRNSMNSTTWCWSWALNSLLNLAFH